SVFRKAAFCYFVKTLDASGGLVQLIMIEGTFFLRSFKHKIILGPSRAQSCCLCFYRVSRPPSAPAKGRLAVVMKRPAPTSSDSATPCFPNQIYPAPDFPPGVSILERVLNEIGTPLSRCVVGELSPGVE